MQTTTEEIQAYIKERFAALPKPIQNAIVSADLEKNLRKLADTHKLHLDQWQILENEVLMALYGIHPVEDLEGNIKANVGVSAEIAANLTDDISQVVFEPIRAELERELDHPEAKKKEEGNVEAARTEVLAKNMNTAPSSPIPPTPQSVPVVPPATREQPAAVLPATPPPSPPAIKATRSPASGAYKPGEASHVRKDITDDPYREPPA